MRWAGNKSDWYADIKKYISQKRYWIEPFFGGGNVGLKVMQDFDFYMYLVNDIKKIIYKTFKLLSDFDLAKQLIRKIENLVMTEEYYKDLNKKIQQENYKDLLDEVYTFWVVKYFNLFCEMTEKLVMNRFTKYPLIEQIKEARDILRNSSVIIYNKNYKDFLKNCNDSDIKKSCYIFCDPPYNGANPTDYKGKFDMIELFESLEPFMNNPILITYNDYQDDWKKYGFYLITNLKVSKHTLKSKREVLIGNKYIKKDTLF